MAKYKKELGAVLSKVDDEYIIIKGRDVYKVNEVAARIFDLCDGKNDEAVMTSKLSSFFNVEKEVIEKDIHAFTKQLLEIELLKEC